MRPPKINSSHFKNTKRRQVRESIYIKNRCLNNSVLHFLYNQKILFEQVIKK